MDGVETEEREHSKTYNMQKCDTISCVKAKNIWRHCMQNNSDKKKEERTKPNRPNNMQSHRTS